MAQDTDTYRSFHDIVADHAGRWPDRVFVHCIDQKKSLTYGQLSTVCNRIVSPRSGRVKEAGFFTASPMPPASTSVSRQASDAGFSMNTYGAPGEALQDDILEGCAARIQASIEQGQRQEMQALML